MGVSRKKGFPSPPHTHLELEEQEKERSNQGGSKRDPARATGSPSHSPPKCTTRQ
jgi:hypothetical protein